MATPPLQVARKAQGSADEKGGRGLALWSLLAVFAGIAYCASLGTERFTQALGGLAVLAFAAVLLLVVATVLKEAAGRRSARFRSRHTGPAHATREAYVERRLAAFRSEVERMETAGRQMIEETIEEARPRLRALVESARAAIARVSSGYARSSKRGASGEDALKEQFLAGIREQWTDLQSELGYAAFSQIEGRLIEARESWMARSRSYGGPKAQPAKASGEDERALRLAALFEAIRYDRLHLLRSELNAAQQDFGVRFQESVRDWANQAVFRCVVRLRERGSEGVTIDDTGLKTRIVRLKSVLELIARLSDRLVVNQSDAGDERATLSRLAFACMALDIIASAPVWFPEMGAVQSDADPVVAVSSSPGVALEAAL